MAHQIRPSTEVAIQYHDLKNCKEIEHPFFRHFTKKLDNPFQWIYSKESGNGAMWRPKLHINGQASRRGIALIAERILAKAKPDDYNGCTFRVAEDRIQKKKWMELVLPQPAQPVRIKNIEHFVRDGNEDRYNSFKVTDDKDKSHSYTKALKQVEQSLDSDSD